MATWEVREGDALERLRGLPAGSVQCCVTSPPYFGLRDYGIDGQIGLERSPDEFVARLVEVFREVRRVLRSDGTLWLNIGDSYAGSWGNQGRKAERGSQRPINGGMLTPVHDERYPAQASGTGTIPDDADYKPKDLLGIPWLLAFALRADGWYLRSDVIWAKPNPMPESVSDRPTSAHEHVFLLAKSARYFYDADAIREPNALHGASDEGYLRNALLRPVNGATSTTGAYRMGSVENGRNKRNVWEVITQPYAGAHFATFPPKLIEPCILAGSSPKACGVCGAPWERVVKNHGSDKPKANDRPTPPGQTLQRGLAAVDGGARWLIETIGWQPSCDHADDTGRSVVLDPFAGAGTTGLVALRHDRSFIGIELNSSYAEMARERIRQDAPLLNTPAEGEIWQPRSLTVPLSNA